MRKIVICFFCLPLSLLSASLKEDIAKKELALEKTKGSIEKSKLHYELALANFADQEQEKAFRHFLLALKNAPASSPYEMSASEKEIFEKAFSLYLKEGMEASEELLKTFHEEAKKFPSLNFLLATAYANLGNFEQFFSEFYKNFAPFKETFLAYKTQAILNLRLRATAKTDEEKKSFEKEAIILLEKALAKNKQDSSIYKFLFIVNVNRLELIQTLCENEVVLPRGEIFTYVKEAIDLKDFELAEKLIAIQKKHYEFSRTLSQAEEYLKQKRADQNAR